MTQHATVTPSPFATHADLAILRREIQLDVRQEMRDFMSEVRHSLREMEANTATQKQWTLNMLFSIGNLVTAGAYVAWSMWMG